MGVLEQITQMRDQGMDESSIINSLQEQGFSPKEINDGLNQSKIKNAVTDNDYGAEMDGIPSPITGETYEKPSQGEANYPNYDYSGQDAYAGQQGYADYGYGGYDAYASSDNMVEIAEQVFADKIRKIEKQIEVLMDFQNIATTRIETNTNRLKRIEAGMDKLQLAILDKVGSYGTTLETIKKEMNMMQNTFQKAVEHKQSTKKSSSNKKSSSKK